MTSLRPRRSWRWSAQQNGRLADCPTTLWFFVKGEPGILLIPPVPVGRLTGGGAGFKDLAATVNGNYFAIPPIKLRGAVSGAYLHLIEGTGDVVLGPSEISLTASDVGIVGGEVIGSSSIALATPSSSTGRSGTMKGTPYTGRLPRRLGGARAINLPSTKLDVIVLKSSIELGAFGGTGMKTSEKHLYLGIGANGKVNGILQIPSSAFIPCLREAKLSAERIFS
ncbi:MAG: hypothetical protein ACLUS6_07515 [Dysosmobacter sp.]